MTAIFPEYRVDHLVLLVGGNPLPNLVATRLQADLKTQIILVYSVGTQDVQDRLRELLTEQGYPCIQVLVEESNPWDIRNRVERSLRGRSGRVGIHYTGGTKAMAVNICKTARDVISDENLFLSYLDARSLKLWVEGPGIDRAVDRDVSLQVEVSLMDLLRLHKMDDLPQKPRITAIWPTVTQALAKIHTDSNYAATWRDWCQKTLRREDKPDKFKSPTQLKVVSTETIPFDSVRAALNQDIPGLVHPATFEQIVQLSQITKPFRKADEKMAQWFDGGWMEDYVFEQIAVIAQSMHIHDLSLSIEPHWGQTKFEFDVACIRGYRLFAISCTTSKDTKLCKSKLLEAIIRARQLGGDEARVALICCSDDPQGLEQEIIELLNNSPARVFGRTHVLNLAKELQAWIEAEGRS